MAALVVIWLAFAAVGAFMGLSKGRALLGFILGLALGLIGVIIVALLPNRTAPGVMWNGRKRSSVLCPWCLARISPAVRSCGHCLRPVTPSTGLRAARR
jgi:hypothetical protein